MILCQDVQEILKINYKIWNIKIKHCNNLYLLLSFSMPNWLNKRVKIKKQSKD